MTDTKRVLEIRGRLVHPLVVGAPAVVVEENHWRCTSTVIEVTRKSKTQIEFETLNTHYLLHLPKGDWLA